MTGWHGVALKNDGSLIAWGNNYHGQCDVPEGNDFVKVAAGSEHSVALKTDGSLAAWGRNQAGQCDVPDGNNYADIAAGSVTNVAITSGGSLVEWGYHYTEPCDGNDSNDCDPNGGDVPSGNDFVDVAVGQGFCLALRSDRSVAAWGQNIYDECNVPETNDFVEIAAGMKHGLAIRENGSLAAWGRNDDGACNVPDGNDYAQIAGGWYHSIAVKTDGTLMAWGRNLNGQCDVPEGNDFVVIAAGDEHSSALTSGQLVTLTVQTEPNDMNSIIPGIGVHDCYIGQRVNVNARRHPNCPDVYEFHHWTGDIPDSNSQSQYLTMSTDRTITAHYQADTRECGDECHPLLPPAVNKDCYINFADFAIFADGWVLCTHPDCD
jgi:alpha-tubulin suppressor-like RCC1 family protein